MTVDPRAATGFARDIDAYERGRPQYPDDAIDRLVREFGLTRESTVLDLAAGTGKLTRQLVAHAGRVFAVEPSPAMRAELIRQVPQAKILDGTAEAIPLGDQTVEAVFVGQAFHWFRVGEAFQEIGRVLRAGGGLAALWNRERWDGPWVKPFNALTGPVRAAAGSFPGAHEWRAALHRCGTFTPWQEAHFTQVHRIAVEDFVALVASWSWIANLPTPERGRLLAEVRRLVADEVVLDLAYATEIYWSWRT